MPTTLTYPTYSINGWAAGVDDDNGARWGVSTQGALDVPATRMRTADRPYEDGSFRAPSFVDSRTIPLTGWCQTQGRVTARQARDLLVMAFPSGDQQSLQIDDGVSVRECTVERSSDIKIKFGGNPYLFQWQFSVWAADGRYFDLSENTSSTTLPTPGATGLDWATGGGLDWATGGGLNWGSGVSNGTFAMANTGTAKTWPRFVLAGPLVNPVITNTGTGQTLAYNGTINLGETLTIETDPIKRGVTLDGADRFTLMTSAAWFPIQPKSSVTVALAASSGTGTLSAFWSNTSW